MARNDLVGRLEALKKYQEEARRTLDRVEGERAQLLRQLKDKYGLDDLESAEKKLQSMRKDVERRKERAERLLAELEAVVNG